jgi:anti-anti-sigma regulatory factor
MSEVEQPAGNGREAVPGSVALADAGGPVLVFTGVVDKDVVRAFRLRVPPALWPGRVDLSAVTSLDAAAVQLLVHLARKPRRQGRELDVVGVPAALRATLERVGLARLGRPEEPPAELSQH